MTSERPIEAETGTQEPWFAAYVLANHERTVAKQLEERAICSFLPTYKSVRRWKDRRKLLDLPLFPSYLFVQVNAHNRLDLLRLPGVITGLASALPETEEGQEELGKVLERYLEDALGKMDEMRRTEGRHLTEELRLRLARIGEDTEKVRELVGTLRPAFSRRLEARLKELLSGTNVEPSRLAQEAVAASRLETPPPGVSTK